MNGESDFSAMRATIEALKTSGTKTELALEILKQSQAKNDQTLEKIDAVLRVLEKDFREQYVRRSEFSSLVHSTIMETYIKKGDLEAYLSPLREDIRSIQSSMSWGIKIVVGAIISALVGLLLTNGGGK